MKEKTYRIITVISCIVSVACLVKINGLQTDINRMESNLRNQILNVDSSVRNIYSNVDSILSKEASIIVSKEYEYGEMDIENNTIEINVNITPKEYMPGITKAKLYINDEAYDMKMENNSFVLDTNIPLFENSEIPKVVFTEGLNIKTETLDWGLWPRYEYIPSVNAHLSGTWSHGKGYDVKGGVDIDVNANKYTTIINEIGEILLVEVFNGEVINKEKVNAMIDDNNTHHKHAYFDLNKKFDLKGGETYDLYTVLDGGNGLLFVNHIDHCELDEKGNAIDTHVSYRDADIYTKDGTLIFRGE